ncbi:MAG: hypothetical protein F4014_07000, partial [Gemmatimonadetes bacterium]|nr:hypothetical protein [Gemmatimonadota bacterium]
MQTKTIKTILLNEWRLLAADRTLRIVLPLFIVLFAYALANGMAWVRFQEHTVQVVREGNVQRTEGLERELAAIKNGAEP